MRTKSFLIAAISVISLSLVAAGLALAKKPDKPPRPGDAPTLLTTFTDGPDDKVTSDGGEAYSTSWREPIKDSRWGFEIETGDRTLFMDLSECVSDTCETFFSPATSGDTSIKLDITAGMDLTEMPQGEEVNVLVWFTKEISRDVKWEIRPYYDPYIPVPIATLTGSDRDRDGTYDSWEVVVTPDIRYDISYCEKIRGRFVCTDKGSVSIPFTLTVESDQN